jgi:hypothetical protein
LNFTQERSQFNITKINLTNFTISSVLNPIQFIVDGKENDILINLNSSWMALLKQNFHQASFILYFKNTKDLRGDVTVRSSSFDIYNDGI